jgi:cell division protease FtsH
LFKSDVEALIGKRPYEEKKLLDVDENGTEQHERGTIDEGVPPYDSSLKAPNLA